MLPRARTTSLLVVVAMATLSSCSSTTPETVHASIDRATWGLQDVVGPSYVVLIVDDAPAGAALRQAVLAELRASVAAIATPAEAWTPVDFRVIVVRPSGAGAHATIGAAIDPRLTWREDNASAAGGEAMVAGIESVLGGVQVDPSVPYRPLEAAADFFALLSYPPTRQPRSADEEALARDAAVYRIGVVAKLLIASARDDASPLPVRSYARLPTASVSLIEPAAADCVPATTTRLAEWGRDIYVGQTLGFPCSAPPRGDAISATFSAHSTCTPRPVVADADGVAECLVTATTDANACSPLRGWLDPRSRDGARRPAFDGPARVCEVPQLTGEALRRCRSGLPVSGVGSGWCLDERPSGCVERLRGIGGALTGSARFSFACNLRRP